MTTSAVLPSATSIKKEEDMGIAVSLRQEERSKDNRDTSIVLSFIWIFFILLTRVIRSHAQRYARYPGNP